MRTKLYFNIVNQNTSLIKSDTFSDILLLDVIQMPSGSCISASYCTISIYD